MVVLAVVLWPKAPSSLEQPAIPHALAMLPESRASQLQLI